MKPSAERFPRKGRKPLKRNIPDFPADAVKLCESIALIRIGINLEPFVRLQRQREGKILPFQRGGQRFGIGNVRGIRLTSSGKLTSSRRNDSGVNSISCI